MDCSTIIYLFSDKPSAPTRFQVTDVGADFATIKWEPPKNDGGLPINTYSIERRDMTRMLWISVDEVRANTKEFTIGKLLEGRNYQFRLSALNDEGEGAFAYSEVINCQKPPGNISHQNRGEYFSPNYSSFIGS